MLRFYWRLVKLTPLVLVQAFKRFDLFASALAALLALVGFSAWQQFLPWWVPLVAFLFLLLYGFLRANYEEFQKVENKKEQLESKVATDEKRASVKDLLGTAYANGSYLVNNEGDIEGWVATTRNLIEAAFSKSEAQLFLSNRGYTLENVEGVTSANSGHRFFNTDVFWIEARLKRLEDLIFRADSLNIRPGFDPQELESRLDT